MTSGVCDFEGGCQAPEMRCAVCAPEELRQNYNLFYLQGQKHVTDKHYQQLIQETYGHDIPEEDLYTTRVNNYYVSLNPEENRTYLMKKLAENGLYKEEDFG